MDKKELELERLKKIIKDAKIVISVLREVNIKKFEGYIAEDIVLRAYREDGKHKSMATKTAYDIVTKELKIDYEYDMDEKGRPKEGGLRESYRKLLSKEPRIFFGHNVGNITIQIYTGEKRDSIKSPYENLEKLKKRVEKLKNRNQILYRKIHK
jgi:hypothetical protein